MLGLYDCHIKSSQNLKLEMAAGHRHSTDIVHMVLNLSGPETGFESLDSRTPHTLWKAPAQPLHMNQETLRTSTKSPLLKF